MDYLKLIGRKKVLFQSDLEKNSLDINEIVEKSSFLVIGGAGSIGQSVSREIFKRNPKTLHVVDISENNMVELVRDLRSTVGYGTGDFRTFSIDSGGMEFKKLIADNLAYDYVFNLSALKHVRSEKDPYTLMRMTRVNILNTLESIRATYKDTTKKYFCVSTDKAANPVNMMGASKRIMEMFLMRDSLNRNLSMARFANVAFSDGSLLHGFNQRFAKRQPISAPKDVQRYFLTPTESGELCLLSGLLGENRDVFFPKLSEDLHLINFSEIARRYLDFLGFEAFECQSEDEARERSGSLIKQKKWPCYFFESDTTGEKDFEEFYSEYEKLDLNRFQSIGIIKNEPEFDSNKLDVFQENIERMIFNASWTKEQILEEYCRLIPSFAHKETGKYLDQRM